MDFLQSIHNKIHRQNLPFFRQYVEGCETEYVKEKQQQIERWQQFQSKRFEIVNAYIDAKRKQRMISDILKLSSLTLFIKFFAEKLLFVSAVKQ